MLVCTQISAEWTNYQPGGEQGGGGGTGGTLTDIKIENFDIAFGNQ